MSLNGLSKLVSAYLLLVAIWSFSSLPGIFSVHGMPGSEGTLNLSPLAVQIIGGLEIALAIASFFLKRKELAYFPIWIGWVVLALANPLSITVEQGYLTYLLFAMGAAHYLERQHQDWKVLKPAMWIVLGLGYFLAATAKLQDPQWQTGVGLEQIVFDFSDSYTWLQPLRFRIPTGTWTFLNYFVIGSQLLFLPSLAVRRLRLIGWWMVTLFQIGALFFLPVPEICAALLLLHLFCYGSDPKALFRKNTPEIV